MEGGVRRPWANNLPNQIKQGTNIKQSSVHGKLLLPKLKRKPKPKPKLKMKMKLKLTPEFLWRTVELKGGEERCVYCDDDHSTLGNYVCVIPVELNCLSVSGKSGAFFTNPTFLQEDDHHHPASNFDCVGYLQLSPEVRAYSIHVVVEEYTHVFPKRKDPGKGI